MSRIEPIITGIPYEVHKRLDYSSTTAAHHPPTDVKGR